MHPLIATSSFGGVSVPDLGTPRKLAEIVSGSQSLYNQTTFLSQSLFNDQVSAFNMSGSLTMNGSTVLTGSLTLVATGSFQLTGTLSVQGLTHFVDRYIVASSGGTLTSFPNLWMTQSCANATFTHMAANAYSYPNPIGVNDYLHVELYCQDDVSIAQTYNAAVALGFSVRGGAWSIGGAFDGTGCPAWFIPGYLTPLRATYTGPVRASQLPFAANDLSIGVFAAQNSGGTATVQLAQPYMIVVNHYRANVPYTSDH